MTSTLLVTKTTPQSEETIALDLTNPSVVRELMLPPEFRKGLLKEAPFIVLDLRQSKKQVKEVGVSEPDLRDRITAKGVNTVRAALGFP